MAAVAGVVTVTTGHVTTGQIVTVTTFVSQARLMIGRQCRTPPLAQSRGPGPPPEAGPEPPGESRSYARGAPAYSRAHPGPSAFAEALESLFGSAAGPGECRGPAVAVMTSESVGLRVAGGPRGALSHVLEYTTACDSEAGAAAARPAVPARCLRLAGDSDASEPPTESSYGLPDTRRRGHGSESSGPGPLTRIRRLAALIGPGLPIIPRPLPVFRVVTAGPGPAARVRSRYSRCNGCAVSL